MTTTKVEIYEKIIGYPIISETEILLQQALKAKGRDEDELVAAVLFTLDYFFFLDTCIVAGQSFQKPVSLSGWVETQH